MKEKNVYRNSGYKAFFKRIPDGRGGQILRETCKEYARKGGEFLNLLLKVPGMARLFLPVSGGAWLSRAESRILQKR